MTQNAPLQCGCLLVVAGGVPWPLTASANPKPSEDVGAGAKGDPEGAHGPGCGLSQLLGGGATIRREAGRLDYERLRGQLAERTREMEQDIELKAGLAEALRLYRDGGAGRAAEGGVD